MNRLSVIHKQTVLDRELNIYGSIDAPLFLAKEVAEWIEHTAVHMMMKTVDEDEKVRSIVSTLGGDQEVWLVTEDGLYEVFMQSRKPIAKQFKKQIKQILKTIRSTGGYVLQNSEQQFIENYFHGFSEETKKAMVLDLQDSNKRLQEQIEAQKPKVMFAEVIEKSDDSLLIRDFAKVISKKGFVIGERRLFAWLRENAYIDKKNRPYQRYIDQGLFELIEHPVVRSSGTEIRFTPRITGKGQLYFANKLLAHQVTG